LTAFAGWCPDGRWLLFWSVTQCSNSIAADGLPLGAVPVAGGTPIRVVGHMQRHPDFLSWCGTRFSFHAHFDWPDEIDWHQPR
jgi:hypothetical protein